MHHPPQGRPGFAAPPPWPQPPQPPRRNSKVWMVSIAIVTAAVVISGALVAVAWLYINKETAPATQPAVAPSTPMLITVDGSLELMEKPARKIGQKCAARSWGYDDIHEGAQVTVTNETGTILAVGILEAGTSTGSSCRFPFTVSVPPGHAFYGFEIGDRGVIRYSENQLRATGAQLSLGD